MERLMVPLNPLTLLNVIVDVLVEPAGMLRKVGFALIAKSGPGWPTVKNIVTLRERLPLVPVTVSE